MENSTVCSLLLKEASLASSCLGKGLTSLRKASYSKSHNYYSAFFLLTIGLERLGKIIILSNYRSKNKNQLPKNDFLKTDVGHNISKIFKRVNQYEFKKNKNIILADPISQKIIEFLSSFASQSRYYNLNLLTGIKGLNQNPLSNWKSIEIEIIRKEKIIDKNDKTLIDNLNETAFVQVFDEEHNLLSDFQEIIEKLSSNDTLQSYNVLYVYRIIKNLAEKLRIIEEENNLFPHLREFFIMFYGYETDYKIRKRKNFEYLK